MWMLNLHALSVSFKKVKSRLGHPFLNGQWSGSPLQLGSMWVSFSLVPSHCAFVACSMKFCTNFILQATNTRNERNEAGVITDLRFVAKMVILKDIQ